MRMDTHIHTHARTHVKSVSCGFFDEAGGATASPTEAQARVLCAAGKERAASMKISLHKETTKGRFRCVSGDIQVLSALLATLVSGQIVKRLRGRRGWKLRKTKKHDLMEFGVTDQTNA